MHALACTTVFGAREHNAGKCIMVLVVLSNYCSLSLSMAFPRPTKSSSNALAPTSPILCCSFDHTAVCYLLFERKVDVLC